MSLSKAASKQPQEMKCSRCRHHGIIVPKKGHTKFCPFLSCDCWKCYLITQRNQQKAQSEVESKGQPPCEEPAAEGADGGARQLATSGLRGGGGGGRRSAAWCPAGGASNGKEETRTPYNDVAPLPVIHLPFQVSVHCPSGCVPCPHFMPPRPAGGLCGPRPKQPQLPMCKRTGTDIVELD
ncbi:Doublesex- and mab-3-related transcription factor A1 [Collichthys lucidus]|uniref:Doublesex-and mab-3-related transcription factor A1 n=1 Tax=Collichthys lucidus TaxID=240159 RepID=A0A4U5VLA4_COLLU|nr:Doublesex- and mab-3-related transcription factor A1 [Collichthys lucidus]TKS89151.1 Doublesex- and mab-3-related transcription factor A1 [Collichthys lucidus]